MTAYGDLLLMDDSGGINRYAYDPYKPYHNPCFFPLLTYFLTFQLESLAHEPKRLAGI